MLLETLNPKPEIPKFGNPKLHDLWRLFQEHSREANAFFQVSAERSGKQIFGKCKREYKMCGLPLNPSPKPVKNVRT